MLARPARKERSTLTLALGLGLGVAATATATRAAAQGLPPHACGPDCTTPGRYVLCNDGFDSNQTSGGGTRLDEFLDATCLGFDAPGGPPQVEGFVALFGPGELFASAVELYEELGTERPGPPLFDTGAQIPASPSAGFSGLFFGAQPVTSSFRLCIRQQVDDPSANANVRPVLYDSDGVMAHATEYRPATGWARSLAGDPVLRAIITGGDLSPWSPGGACAPGSDGGVGLDSGPDGGGGPGDRDAGGDLGDGGPPSDAGASTTDAGPAGPDGGGVVGPDGGTSTLPAPQLTAISPAEGSNLAAVSVIVTGSGFIPGLTLRIGTISAEQLMVPGPSTIQALVPANILPGKYDVVVQNPDGQAAVLPGGYSVLSRDGAAPAADACACVAAAPGPTASSRAPVLGWLVLGALLIPATRRRAQLRVPGSTRPE